MEIFDVIIIGAGVTGAMTARELTRLGMNCAILERNDDVATGASRANSGIVHAGFDAKEGSLKARLNVRGSEMMEDLCREMNVSYYRCGSIVVGFDDADRETLSALLARGKANGVKGLEIISGDEARKKEPALQDTVTSALLAPTGAIVCPYELTIAAAGVAMNNGCKLFTNTAVKALSYKDGVWTAASEDGRAFFARYIINAAGTHADEIARLAGDDSFSIRPRRGEYYLLDRETAGLVRSTVFMTPSKMGKGVLVSPTAHGNIIIGPTATDVDDRDDVSTTAEGLAKVKELAVKSVKNIPFGKSITSFCGLRAVPSTGDFIINSPVKGFINCAGIESPGLSSAPAIAEYIADILRDKYGEKLSPRADFDGSYLSAVAFKSLSVNEKNGIIKKDPAYGRVVCRCETVTEGEIVAAIRQNPPARDVDAVKRRTRCGMGRCQGGFCTPNVTAILARELGVDELEITRSGGDSRLFAGKTK